MCRHQEYFQESCPEFYLLSWKMVMPDGNWLQVERLNHNQDKIQLLKEVSFEIHHLKKDRQRLSYLLLLPH
jgi:hypothetical protein